MRRFPLHVIFAILLTACCVGSPASSPPQHPLDRVAVIGASATAGLGVVLRYTNEDGKKRYVPAGLDKLLAAMVKHPNLKIVGSGRADFFFNPLLVGQQQIETASQASPTLVVALDFLFWHGYGRRNLSGEEIPEGAAGRAARLALLEQGLLRLEELDCPILLGDFPDVSDADVRWLSPNQIPDSQTLSSLNARIYEWAADRPNVTVVRLSRMVHDMKSGQTFTAGGQTWEGDQEHGFLQRDKLHPTLEGLIIMIQEGMDGFAQTQLAPGAPAVDLDLEANRQKIYRSMQPVGFQPLPYHLDQ